MIYRQTKKIAKKIIILLSASYLLGCVETESSNPAINNGQGGSTARFVIQKDHLVIVEDRRIRSFNLDNPLKPKLIDTSSSRGPRLETVFPYGEDLVLIGTNRGAVIVKITDDGLIDGLSFASHFTSRDPVVAENNVMYVTIRPDDNQSSSVDNSGVLENRGSNRLIVFDISDVNNPKELIQKPIDNPSGLSISGTRLYVCFSEGLRIYDVTKPSDPQVITDYADFPCNDVIATESNLIATGDDGVQLLDNKKDVISLLASIRQGD